MSCQCCAVRDEVWVSPTFEYQGKGAAGKANGRSTSSISTTIPHGLTTYHQTGEYRETWRLWDGFIFIDTQTAGFTWTTTGSLVIFSSETVGVVEVPYDNRGAAGPGETWILQKSELIGAAGEITDAEIITFITINEGVWRAVDDVAVVRTESGYSATDFVGESLYLRYKPGFVFEDAANTVVCQGTNCFPINGIEWQESNGASTTEKSGSVEWDQAAISWRYASWIDLPFVEDEGWGVVWYNDTGLLRFNVTLICEITS